MNTKLVISLLHTNILLTVLIMSCGLVKDRILCTSRKNCVEHESNMRESFVKDLVVKVDAKILLVRSRRRWKNNIKMILQGLE